MNRYNRGLLFMVMIFSTIQVVLGQLKTYTIGETSLFSHSCATEKDSSFAFSYSNQDGNLVVCCQKDGCWTYDEVIEAGSVFMTAIAIDSSENMHILFTRRDIASWPRAELYYITNTSGEWSEPVYLADSDQGINSLEMAMDKSGKIHAGYMKGKPASSGKMIYLTNKSGSWVASFVGSELEAYDCCSMALDKNGFVHYAFYGFTPYLGPGYITNAPSGTWQSPVEIHPDWRGGQMEGSTISIATDSASFPHIAYSGDTKTEPASMYMEHQQYAWKTQTGWKHLKIENCNFQGAPNRIMIDSSHTPVIVYSNTLTDKMMLAKDSSGTWVKKALSTPAVHGKITHQRITNGHQCIMWDDWTGELTLLTDAPFAAGTLDRENIDFGEIFLGKDSTQTLFLINTEDAELKICNVTISGPDKGEFYSSFDKPVLKPGDTCRISVTFKPLARGGKKASLLILSNSMDLSLRDVILTAGCNIEYSQWAFDHKGKFSLALPSSLSTKDGNYLVGTKPFWMGDTIVVSNITKLDGSGKLIWMKKSDYLSVLYFDGAINRVTGNCFGYMLAGVSTDEERKSFEPVFLLLDTAGNYQWGKKINNLPMAFSSVINTPDGGWILCGQKRSNEEPPYDNIVLVIKTDSAGTIQWQKEYDFGGRMPDVASQLRVKPLIGEAGYILIYSKFDTSNNRTAVNVVTMRIDMDGNILWSRIIGFSNIYRWNIPIDIIETLGRDSLTNGYLILSHPFIGLPDLMYISKLDIEGNLLWSKEYGPNYTVPDAVKQTSDSTFVVLSHKYYYSSNAYYQLMGIDDSGNILWKNGFKGLGMWYTPSSISVCQDKGYLFSTLAYISNRYDIFRIIKTDSLGQIPGCDLQVNSDLTVSEIADPSYRVEDLEVQVNPSSHTLVDFITSLENQYCQISEACSYSEPVDADKDGYADEIESGPLGDDAGYDGNGDGTPDNQQVNVVSFHSHLGDYVTIASPPGTSLFDVRTESNPDPPSSPDSLVYSYDFFIFTVNGVQPGGATQVDLFFPQGLETDTYFKFGSVTLKDFNSETFTQYGFWYEFMYNDTTGAVIDSNHIILHFVDGKLGDDDLEANGTITDMGGPSSVLRPKMSCSADTLRFTTLRPTQNESRNLIIKNSGDYKLLIDTIRFFGKDSLMFSVSPPKDSELSPGDSITLPVTFTPTKTGSMKAWITIYSNDRDNREKKIGIDAACLDPSGIEEELFIETPTFSVYPNPVDEFILVMMGNSRFIIAPTYQLINMYGKTIQSGHIEQSSRINTQHLPAGIYVLRIISEGRIFSQKIVIGTH